MIVLQPYKDWLMLTRGKIEPRVGDKIRIIGYNQTITLNSVENGKILFKERHTTDLSNCYVEVSYPVIEWKETDSYSYILQAYINSIKTELRIVGYLIHDKSIFDECFLHKGDFTITKGNLEYLKQQANQLLYGTTE